MDVRRDVDARDLAAPSPAGLQRSRSTATGLAGIRSLSRRFTHNTDRGWGAGEGLNAMSFGAILSRTCSSVAYRHSGGVLPGEDRLRVSDEQQQGYSSSSHGFPAAGAMMRRAFSLRAGADGYGRIHDTRDEDDEGLQRRAAGLEKEKKKKRAAGRRIVGACKRILGIKSNKV